MVDVLKATGGAPSSRRSWNWLLDAACAGTKDPELFFMDGPAPAEALALCHTCPVRLACLRHALIAGERYGIWGGLTPDERANYLVGRGPEEVLVA